MNLSWKIPQYGIGTLLVIVGLLYIISLHHFSSLSESVSFSAARAFVERREWDITPYWEQPTIDHVVLDGKFYSEKPPLQAILSIPFYALGQTVTRLLDWDPPNNTPAGGIPHNRTRTLLMLFVTPINIASGILATLTVYLAARVMGASKSNSLIAAAIFSVATLVFVYATASWRNALDTFLISLLWLFLLKARENPEGRFYLLAGLVLGLSLLNEYHFVLLFPLFLGYVIYRERSVIIAIKFCLTFAIGLALWASYNYLAFGSPFEISFLVGELEFTVVQEVSPKFLLSGIPGLLFMPIRGLFFHNPILLFGLVGLYLAAKQGFRDIFILEIAILVTLLLFLGSRQDWPGGWAWGARHLMPTIPMMAVGLAFLDFKRMAISLKALFILFLLWSWYTSAIGVVTFPKGELVTWPIIENTLELVKGSTFGGIPKIIAWEGNSRVPFKIYGWSVMATSLIVMAYLAILGLGNKASFNSNSSSESLESEIRNFNVEQES